MEIDLDVTVNFEFLAQNQDKRIILLEGSSRSGKTFAVCQYIVFYCLTNEQKVVTIARDNLVVAKRTVLLDFLDVLRSCKIKYNQNKTDVTFTINSNTVRFVGLDDVDKVHGMKQDLLYVNEGLNISKDIYNQLLQRTSWQAIIDYNPSALTHFLYQWGENREGACIFKSTIFDNPKAPEESVKQILSYKPSPENDLQGTSNPYYWEVYGMGRRYRGNEVVIRSFKRFNVPLRKDEIEWVYYGMDFGYTEPTTLVEVAKIKNAKKIFCRVYIYESGLTNDQIAERITGNALIDNDVLIIADSAEPKSITELRGYGINAIKSAKGAHSIYFGIQKLQQFEIYVYMDALSQRLATEFENLRYLTDGNGDIIKDAKNYPILKKGGDHCVDPIRYILNKFANL